LNLSPTTSVFMIKHIILNRTKIDLTEQLLYMDNRILQDKELISDIHSSCLLPLEGGSKSKSFDCGSVDYTETSSPRFLKLKLITKQSKSKFKLGLDFSFNYLKSLKKINWEDDAPSYREISDGVCLICYCGNKDCVIFNQMFVHNLGIGKFEVIEEIAEITCEQCLGTKVEVRNIGFVNCEWIYKGTLKQNSESRVSGEGRTMDRKLHTFKEVNISNLFDKLYVNVCDVETKEDPDEYVPENTEQEAAEASIISKLPILNNNNNKNFPKVVNEHETRSKEIIDEILNGKNDESDKSKCLIF